MSTRVRSTSLRRQSWQRITAAPSLDLRFAETKGLLDAVSGQNLITFTRASSGTYVDSTGTLRTARTNLLLRSEEFDNVAWTPTNAATPNANAAVAPNGTVTAYKLITNNGSTGGQIFQTFSLLASTVYTFSVFAKASEWSWCKLTTRGPENSDIGAWFDLSNGTVGTVESGVTASIQPVGDGWYRCIVTRTTGTGATAGRQRIYSTNADNALSTGDATSGLFLWGAQLEQSSTVGEYVPTTSTINSASRFDHNPVTGESLGLLVEEQRTNEVRNSNSMSAVVTGSPGTMPTNWSAQGNANGWTREIIGSGSLGSLNYVDIRFSGTPTGSQFVVVFQPQNVASASNGQTWAASVYHQLVGGSLGNVVGYPAANLWNSSGVYLGGLGLSGSTVSSSTLQRYAGSATIAQATTASISWGITFTCTAGNTYDFTIRFAGPQLEAGAFPTSYIPTTAAAATRSADVASITGSNFSSWYRQDEGTVFANARTNATHNGVNSFPRILAVNDGSNSNIIENYYRVLSSYTDAGYRIDSGGVVQTSFNTNNERNGQSSAIRYAANNFVLVIGGTIANLNTSGTVPTVTQLQIGARADGSSVLNGHIRRLTYYPARLSNANLRALTQ